jgi:hypothetical protein
MRSQVPPLVTVRIPILGRAHIYFHLHNQRITWSHVLKVNGMEGRNLKFRTERVSSDMQSRRRMMYLEADAAAEL